MDEVAARPPISDASHRATRSPTAARTAAPLRVSTSRDAQGTPLIEVSGEIDLSTVDVLRDAVDAFTGERSVEVEALRSLAPPDRLIFDLSRVTFIDSTGVALLVAATDRVATVVLRKPSPVVLRIVELVALTPLVRIED